MATEKNHSQSSQTQDSHDNEPKLSKADELELSEPTSEGGEAEVMVELTMLQDELIAAKDQSLRTQAEMQNLRRRSERDVENAHKYALEKFVGELLPVVDNLERALQAADQNNDEL